jgi:glycosyltransferase involved in cell wall biosynthesis
VAAIGGNDPHQFVDELRSSGIEVLVPKSSYFGEARQVRRFALEHGVNVVHTHGYRSDILTGFAATGLSFRTVSTVHGYTGGDLKNRVYERAQQSLLRRFDAVVAVSRPLETLLRARGVSPGRLRMIPNAMRLDRPVLPREVARERLGLSTSGIVLGWVGRLSTEKAPEVMLHALGRMAANEWIAAFVGDGPDLPELSRLVNHLGVADRVRWLGNIPHAAEVLSAFDLLVMSSRTEGTPMVLLEAMTNGIPIVATAVGGVPDLLGNGEAGWLVPSEDPIAMASAIESALADRSGRESRVSAAKARVASEYDVATWLRRYEAVYRQVVGFP